MVRANRDLGGEGMTLKKRKKLLEKLRSVEKEDILSLLIESLRNKLIFVIYPNDNYPSITTQSLIRHYRLDPRRCICYHHSEPHRVYGLNENSVVSLTVRHEGDYVEYLNKQIMDWIKNELV